MKHYEHYKGYDFYYNLRDKEEPTGLRVEPIFTLVDCGRTCDGKMHMAKKVVGFNVTGIYDEV